MSRQPSPLTDWTSDSDWASDSAESVASVTKKQSTDRRVAPLAKPRLSEDCDACHFASMECTISNAPNHPWGAFSKIRSSAFGGRRCCSLIVDAIETWLRHVDHKAHNAVYLGSGLLFDTLEVVLERFYSNKEMYRNGRYIFNVAVKLRWNARSNDDTEDVSLFIFAPHSMQKQATVYQDISTDRG